MITGVGISKAHAIFYFLSFATILENCLFLQVILTKSIFYGL